ncbi:MAG: hypothetical protein QG618_2252 [Thermodesulfobacteriota bacterium]|jgi:hypothetical protein|nr:hypothetical protein [Thermodesulfobacteriota bacterium]
MMNTNIINSLVVVLIIVEVIIITSWRRGD